jgi:hypothetical protein
VLFLWVIPMPARAVRLAGVFWLLEVNHTYLPGRYFPFFLSVLSLFPNPPASWSLFLLIKSYFGDSARNEF